VDEKAAKARQLSEHPTTIGAQFSNVDSSADPIGFVNYLDDTSCWAALLRKEKAGEVFMGEHELALGMTRHVRVAREA
jgi:hypothetical protein